jgi:two-component system chemotaxis response regulator CheY
VSKGLTAIVTDDSKFMRSILSGMLTKNGVTVLAEAENGSISATLYKHLRPDFVTMDITMPEHNGIEGLTLIREIDPEANVIMVSAIGQSYYIDEATDLGAIDFIVKPFQEDRIREAVSKVNKKPYASYGA